MWYRQRIISGSLIFIGLCSILVGLSSRASAQSYPHLEIDYMLSPLRISSFDQEITLTVNIRGVGGRIEDLPEHVRARLPRKPVDVVLVIDKSGSMDATDYAPDRMTAVKNAAKAFIDQLRPGDRVAAVSFGSSASTEQDFTSDFRSAKSRIDRLSIGGNTAIGDGIMTALSLIGRSREEVVRTIVLLSDGANNAGADPANAANTASGRGVPIYTIGIGTTKITKKGYALDEGLLKAIATTTGGEYLYAPDQDALKMAYERMSGKALNVAGLNVDLSIATAPFFNITRNPTSLHFDVINVGASKTIDIKGRVSLSAPGERLPVASKISITYSDIVSQQPQEVAIGPVYIEFAGEAKRGQVKIQGLEFRHADESFVDATVYHLDDDIGVSIDIQKPSETTVGCTASLLNSKTSKGSSESDTTESPRILHKLKHGGVVGHYKFLASVFYPPGTLTDYESRNVYVIFDEDKEEFVPFSRSDEYKGNVKVTLHPRTERILGTASGYLTDVSKKEEAAQLLTKATHNMIQYSKVTNDHADDYAILDSGQGWCVDFAALYISFVRSLNVPVRGVFWFAREGAHGFAETRVGQEWHHADPTWDAYEQPDVYIGSGRFSGLKGYIESAPGKQERDTATTLKYSVGMVSPAPYSDGNPVVMNLGKKKQVETRLYFENFAESMKEPLFWLFGIAIPNPFAPDASDLYQAKSFRLKVIDSGGMEVVVKGLSRDDTLNTGEKDYATFNITAPSEYLKAITEGETRTVGLKLQVTYKSIGGDNIRKNYTLNVRLEG